MEGKDFVNTLNNGREIRRPPPVFKKHSEGFRWSIIVIIGIVIVFAGSFWVTLAQWTPPPNSQDYHSISDYTKAKREWQGFVEQGNLYGRIVLELGSLVMVLGGFLGYMMVSVDDVEKRAFLVITVVGLFIALVASVGLFVSSPYLS